MFNCCIRKKHQQIFFYLCRHADVSKMMLFVVSKKLTGLNSEFLSLTSALVNSLFTITDNKKSFVFVCITYFRCLPKCILARKVMDKTCILLIFKLLVRLNNKMEENLFLVKIMISN